eukprot:gene12923-17321_t
MSVDSLSGLLTWTLLNQPNLFDELPLIISSLDANEAINVSNIKDNKKKSCLIQILKYLLPHGVLYDDDLGYYKGRENTINIGGQVLNILLTEKTIKQPLSLTSVEKTTSSKYVSLCFEVLNKFPILLSDLPLLFQQLIDGNSVQLNDISDKSIQKALDKLLNSFQLECDEESGYYLPDSSDNPLPEKILEILCDIFNQNSIFEQNNYDFCNNIKPFPVKNIAATKIETSNDLSSDSNNSVSDENEFIDKNDNNSKRKYKMIENNNSNNNSDDNDDKSVESDDNIMHKKRVIGPYLPSNYESFVNNPSQLHDNDEDIDDMGPVPYDSRNTVEEAQMKMRNSLPLGYVGTYFEDEALHKNNDNNNEETEEIVNNNENKRDEWMITPGNSSLIADLTSRSVTNRKFQSGKEAKKLALELINHREKMRKEMESSEEGLKTKAIMDEYKELRGPSLMDKHLLEKNKNNSHNNNNEKEIRKPFDRDRDLLSHRKLDQNKVKEIVENAKQLDSRFDKGMTQKSFL